MLLVSNTVPVLRISILTPYAGSFLPVTLEQLAREQGVLFVDKVTPCTAKNATAIANATVNALMSRATGSDTHQCIINVFGTELTTASFAMYTFSASVFMQAVALVSVSSVADHGIFIRHPKHLFLSDIYRDLA